MMLDPHAMAVVGAVHTMLKQHVETNWREALDKAEARSREPAPARRGVSQAARRAAASGFKPLLERRRTTGPRRRVDA